MVTFEVLVEAMRLALERLADKYPDSKKWEVEQVHYTTVYEAGYAGSPYNDFELVFKTGAEMSGKRVKDLRLRITPAKNHAVLLEDWGLIDEFIIYGESCY